MSKGHQTSIANGFPERTPERDIAGLERKIAAETDPVRLKKLARMLRLVRQGIRPRNKTPAHPTFWRAGDDNGPHDKEARERD
jgi:hypothetical protein